LEWLAAGGASSDEGLAAATNVSDVPVLWAIGQNKGAKGMDEGDDDSGGRGAEDQVSVYLVEAAATMIGVVACRLAAGRRLPRLMKAGQRKGVK